MYRSSPSSHRRTKSVNALIASALVLLAVVAAIPDTADARPRKTRSTTTTTAAPSTTTTTAAPASTTSPSTVSCSRYASTSGSDTNAGSATSPYRSIATLWSKLTAGQTGCLLGGTFTGNLSLRTGGQPGAPITLASAPGTRATIAGVIWIADTANDIVIADLNLDGTNTNAAPSPQINGDRITLRGNDITNNHTGICIVLGGSFPDYGRADHAVIDNNRIHDCGRLPATNHDHGIYIEGSTGSRIVNNVFYGNADWGIHLYPDADNTYIARNIVDGNGKGLIFAGERAGGEYATAHTSDNNIAEYNIITNSTLGDNAESWWGGTVGTGNVFRNNCLWSPDGTAKLDLTGGGFTASGNLTADPLYVDRANHDYRLKADSPCSTMAPAI